MEPNPVNVIGMATSSQFQRLYLAEHREAKGISAPKMAEHMGFTREYLYAWEAKADKGAGKVRWDKVVRYALRLGISPVRLLWPPDADVDPFVDALVRVGAERHPRR